MHLTLTLHHLKQCTHSRPVVNSCTLKVVAGPLTTMNFRYLAEHLRNLNHISVQGETDVDKVVTLRPLEQDRKLGTHSIDQLELYSSELGPGILVNLPDRVRPITREVNSKCFRLRLPLAASAGTPAADQSPRFTPPLCSNGEALVSTATTVKWKQLPSEHWAELMDVWHCHKPDHDHTENSQAKPRHDHGLYGLAINGFHAKPGLAYYSDTHYLVHKNDLSPSGTTVVGSGAPAQSIKIWKWDLGEPVSTVVRAMLRELVDAHAVFTITVNDELAIWVLNAHVECTIGGMDPIRNGLKLLFIDLREFPLALDQRPDAEAVTIPSHAAETLKKALLDVNTRLPSRLRTMNGWKLSII